MQEVAAVGILEEVALQLDTDVAAIAGSLTVAVGEAGKLAHVLTIGHEALVDRVHRILKGEGALELSKLNLEEVVFLPFGENINNSYAAGEVGRRTIVLELNPCRPVGMRVGIDDNTSKTDVERVGLGPFLSGSLVLDHVITGELEHVEPFGQFCLCVYRRG